MQQTTLTLALVVVVGVLILSSLPASIVEGMDSSQCNAEMDTTQRSMTNAAHIDAMKAQIADAELGIKKVDKLDITVEELQKSVNEQREAIEALKGAFRAWGVLVRPKAAWKRKS